MSSHLIFTQGYMHTLLTELIILLLQILHVAEFWQQFYESYKRNEKKKRVLTRFTLNYTHKTKHSFK